MFVEAYGQVAVQGASFSPEVDSALAEGNKRLQAPASPLAAASSPRRRSAASAGWRTPPCSRASGSTTSAATTSCSRSNRFTLADAFKRAGWRTVDDVPRTTAPGRKGRAFYHYDKIYDRYQVGYHGPTFAYASMPDQYIFSALQRLELGKPHRRPLFAEVDTVSSHMPWNRIPEMIPLEPGRQRLDLQPHSGDPRDRRVLEQPRRASRPRTASRSCTR